MKLYFLFICSIFSFLSLAQDVNISQGNLFEGEPFLALNPNNSQNLAVAWMGFEVGEGIVIKVKNSFDGGTTWGNENYLTHETGNGMADPVLKYDNNNNLFLCYIDYDSQDFLEGSVRLRKSTDNGTTWQNSTEVINITDCPNQLCIDRPWMVIDTTNGPMNGAIYITTATAKQPTIVNPPYHPYLTVSLDNGNSFGEPRFLDTVDYYSGSLISLPVANPTIDGNGVFRAIYPSYVFSQSPQGEYYMASSSDGGITLNHSEVYTLTNTTNTSEAKIGRTLLTNPINGNHLVYVIVAGENDLDIFYRESLDAGSTWSEEIRVNDDAIGNDVVQDLAWADFDADGDLVFTWRDRRNGGTGLDAASEIYASVKNNGETFGANFILNDSLVDYDSQLDASGNDFMSTQFNNDIIHSVWGDVRTGRINIFYSRYDLNTNSTSIVEITKDEISFYPNPASNYIELKNIQSIKSLELRNTLGELLIKVISPSEKVDISSLSTGNYFVVTVLKNGVKLREKLTVR